jgi:hypothetical protein
MTEEIIQVERTANAETIRWTVQILLPESVDRELQRKTDKTPGASWPAWGGHVTLLPMFTTSADEGVLQQAVACAVEGFGPIEVTLADVEVEQDLTRPDYHAVFLQMDEESGPLRTLRMLHERLDEATRFMRTDLRPALDGAKFVPHVTCALGLSETEAERVARTLRVDNLSVRFRLKEIVLLGFDASGSGEPSRAYSFPLAAREDAPVVAASKEPQTNPDAPMA